MLVSVGYMFPFLCLDALTTLVSIDTCENYHVRSPLHFLSLFSLDIDQRDLMP